MVITKQPKALWGKKVFEIEQKFNNQLDIMLYKMEQSNLTYREQAIILGNGIKPQNIRVWRKILNMPKRKIGRRKMTFNRAELIERSGMNEII